MSSAIPARRNEIERRLGDGESLRAIACSLGVTYQTLQYHRRRWGGLPLRAGRASGKDHASWRGGKSTSHGYTLVLAPENGRANKYVPEHILVAERCLGRRLGPNEVVHHINGDKADNAESNLSVCTRSAHRRFHGQLERIAFEVLAEGRVAFDTEHGYRLLASVAGGGGH